MSKSRNRIKTKAGEKQRSVSHSKSKRGISAFLALAMLVVVGVVTFTVSAQQGPAAIVEGVPEDITVGTSADPTKVRFGRQEWLVIGYDGEGVYSEQGAQAMTLLLSAGSTGYGSSIFSIFNASGNEYKDSTLQTAMDNAYDTIKDSREAGLVEPRYLYGGSGNLNHMDYDSDMIAGEDVEDVNFWPLSVAEAEKLDSSVREFNNDWWLRSPGDSRGEAAIVDYYGYVYSDGDPVGSDFGIRPAFRFNLESVLFTSDAEGGKSDFEGGAIVTVDAGTGDAVKFTMEDEDQTLKLTGVTTVSNGSGELEFPYSKAATGENQYISAVLVDEDGDVAYYGKLADLTDDDAEDEGTVKLSLEDVEDGDYTLKIFSEQDNGAYNTDYAGEIHEYNLSVANGEGSIKSGLNADPSGGTLVYYGHNYMLSKDASGTEEGYADSSYSPIAWRIMEADENTLTLMSDKLLGQRAYDGSQHNSWSGSDIAQYLNGTDSYDGNGFINESFDGRESGIIGAYGATEETNNHKDIDISQQIVLPET